MKNTDRNRKSLKVPEPRHPASRIRDFAVAKQPVCRNSFRTMSRSGTSAFGFMSGFAGHCRTDMRDTPAAVFPFLPGRGLRSPHCSPALTRSPKHDSSPVPHEFPVSQEQDAPQSKRFQLRFMQHQQIVPHSAAPWLNGHFNQVKLSGCRSRTRKSR